MEFIYPFLIAFLLIFISELGDKTQLLVLSFSSKLKAKTILLGVALGSLFSHGIAILFGSFLGNIENLIFQYFLKIITYISFIIFGIITFLASIGLGIEYSAYKISLICGAIVGMIMSDLIAIVFGRALSHKIPESIMQKFSGILFLIFGLVEVLNFLF